MPACAITITGTTGSVVINYILSGTAHTMNGSFGDSLFINDAATAITYTNISGNAAATSACVTITNLPSSCYILSWSLDFTPVVTGTSGYVQNSNYIFTDVALSTGIVLPITQVSYSNFDPTVLAENINILNDSRVKAVATRVISATYTKELFIVLKITGAFIPELKINNPVGNKTLYIRGIAGDCLPLNYSLFNVCAAP